MSIFTIDKVIKIGQEFKSKIEKIENKIEDINKLLSEYSIELWLQAKSENIVPQEWKIYRHNSIDDIIKIRENLEVEKINYTSILSSFYQLQSSQVKEENIVIGSFEKISIEDRKFIITRLNQGSASSFVKKGAQRPEGFGYLPATYTRYDPTYYNENSLTKLLIPSEDDINNQVPLSLKINGEKEDIRCKGEEEGIVDLFELLLEPYDGFVINKRRSFKDNKISDGIANSNSYDDFHISFGAEIYSVFELKGADGSVLDAVCQAAISATNVALRLLTIGIRSEDCIIPVIGSNGLVVIFGATIVLNNSFPTYIPLSKQLDLVDKKESKIIAAYLTKIVNHCKKLNELKPKSSNYDKAIDKIALEMNGDYYIKKYDLDVYSGGIGIFCNDHNKSNIDFGLNHMIQVFNLLYENEKSRDYVEFPLSIRTPDKSSQDDYLIIYRNLKLLGYKTGFPNRIECTLESWESFKQAYFTAVDTIHEAGVIHLDLYASNIMWKYNEDKFYIKIIDWDCAHCLYENKFHKNVYKSLEEYFKGLECNYKPLFDKSHDKLYINVLNIPITNENKNHWTNLSNDNIPIMNHAFCSLFQEYLKINTL